ncbi:hypothetical protein [Nostoc sphaeroides]|nr:hypothetical protein [Nostoc sphaeroides]
MMWLVLAIALLLTSIIPVRIAIALHQTPVPQAIFVLRDAVERMTFARQGGEGDDFGGEKGAGRIK